LLTYLLTFSFLLLDNKRHGLSTSYLTARCLYQRGDGAIT